MISVILVAMETGRTGVIGQNALLHAVEGYRVGRGYVTVLGQ